MQTKIYNYEDLKYGRSIIDKNPPFELSKQGFTINVEKSLRQGKITQEQKDELLKGLLVS